MPCSVLIVVEGSDLKSARMVLEDLCDQMVSLSASDADRSSTNRSNLEGVGVNTPIRKFDVVVPVALFEERTIPSDHPSFAAFQNPLVIEGCKYVFIDDVMGLSDQQSPHPE